MSRIFWDVILGRVVPLVVFGFIAVAVGFMAMDDQAAAGHSLPAAERFVSNLGTSFFCFLLALSYSSRLPRLAGRRGPLVVLVALAPFFILAGAVGPHRPEAGFQLAGAILVTVGTVYSLTSLAYLRSSFSILPEARALITGGPFALSRHPIYLAEAITTFGILLPVAGVRILLLVPYLACQSIRVRWEEEVLTSQFPEYAGYAARVSRYIPFFPVAPGKRDQDA